MPNTIFVWQGFPRARELEARRHRGRSQQHRGGAKHNFCLARFPELEARRQGTSQQDRGGGGGSERFFFLILHLAGPSQQYFLPDLFAYRPRPGYEQKFKIWASRRIHFRPKAGRHSVVWGTEWYPHGARSVVVRGSGSEPWQRDKCVQCHFIPISRI